MTYVWATWLADALRAEGCQVVEESGWTTRGRPSSKGDFAPFGVCWHHTGTTTSAANPAPTVGYCIAGRDDAPGPLCHVVIGWDGVCHVIAAGRANHAGECGGSGPIPPGDGNEQMIGLEIDYNGTQDMGPAQYQASIRAAAAVLRHFGANETYGRGHVETSVTGKWDPGGYDLDGMRDDTARQLEGEGVADLQHNTADLKCTDFGAVPTEPKSVAWDHEASDPGGIHSDGSGGVRAPFTCSMVGVVEVQVRAGQVDLEIDRYASGMAYKGMIGRGLNLGPGYHSVPFVGRWPANEYLYVRISADADGSVVGSVRLTLDQIEA